MISLKDFIALPQDQKIALLTHTLKDLSTASSTLGKAYAYVTSELPKNSALLDQIYAGLYAAKEETKHNTIQKHINETKKIQEQGRKDFDEHYLDDLLSKA